MDEPVDAGIARWTVGEYLERHNRTAYALAKASGLHLGTVYPIARGQARQVTLDTLTRLASGLQVLTGEKVTLNDLLELAGTARERREGES